MTSEPVTKSHYEHNLQILTLHHLVDGNLLSEQILSYHTPIFTKNTSAI